MERMSRGYFWATSHDIIGRKDQGRFYVDIPAWMESGREAPADFQMPEEPQFLRTPDAILHHSGRSDLSVYNHSGLPYRGPGAVAGEN